MPDRPLKIEELVKLKTETDAFNRGEKKLRFNACDLFFEEGTEPSLHDMVLNEVLGKLEGLGRILIEQGRDLRALKSEQATLKHEIGDLKEQVNKIKIHLNIS